MAGYSWWKQEAERARSKESLLRWSVRAVGRAFAGDDAPGLSSRVARLERELAESHAELDLLRPRAFTGARPETAAS